MLALDWSPGLRTRMWDLLGHGMDPTWHEVLRPGMAMSQASQKSIEDLTKTMWDISRKVMGGQS